MSGDEYSRRNVQCGSGPAFEAVLANGLGTARLLGAWPSMHVTVVVCWAMGMRGPPGAWRPLHPRGRIVGMSAAAAQRLCV